MSPNRDGVVEFNTKGFTKPFNITKQVGSTIEEALESVGKETVLSFYQAKAADSARTLVKTLQEKGAGYADIVSRLETWKPNTRRAKTALEKMEENWGTLGSDERSQFIEYAKTKAAGTV